MRILNTSENRNNYTAFKAIHIDKTAKEIVRTRNNRFGENLIKFYTLSKSQERNPVDIHISAIGKTLEKLQAKIVNDTVGLEKTYQEPFFYFLKNPLKFIQKMCTKADKYKTKYKLK